MSSQRLNLVLAVVFLIIGVLATANTVRLNSYIRVTLPRDQAQEQCNAATIEVLTSWIQARRNRDTAMNARDDAAIIVLDRLVDGQKASPAELQAWRDAVAIDRDIRTRDEKQRVSLPNC